MVAPVVISDHQDVDLLRDTMAAGARDFVMKPLKGPELLQAVRRNSQRVRSRRSLVAPRGPAPRSGIWAFSSPCGGAGQTTLLLAIANELLTPGKRVLVVDLDLEFGTVAFNLGLEQGGRDLCHALAAGRFDHATFEGNLLVHNSGLQILAPPRDLLAAHGLDRERIARMVLASAGHYDYVLLDLGAGLPDGFLSLLDTAQLLFLSTPCSLAAMMKLRRMVVLLTQLNYPAEVVRPLLIGEAPHTRAVQEFEAILERVDSRICQVFPWDRKHCEAAVLAGQPVSRQFPESPYTQSIRDFLEGLLGLPPLPRPDDLRTTLIHKFFGN